MADVVLAEKNRTDPRRRVFAVHAGILREHRLSLREGSKVLDFGCGPGHNTYEYIDAGFEAYGFDLNDEVELRTPGDQAYFPPATRGGGIPFHDETFDFVFSAWVLEHVQDHSAAFAETARVLKRGGVSIHYFPSRYRPIEPHVYVPLAGLIQHRRYLALWARFGIRNEYQHGLPAETVAAKNHKYLKSETNYVTKKQLRAAAVPHFARVEFVEDSYVRNWPGMAGKLAPTVTAAPALRRVVSALHTRVMLLIR